MKLIATEEHFLTEEFACYFKSIVVDNFRGLNIPVEDKNDIVSSGIASNPSPKFLEQLLDCGENRIKQMEAEGVDTQVLSLAIGVQVLEAKKAIEMAQNCNDALSSIVIRYPDRFIGMAAIAPQDPVEAAREIERAVKKLGLKGVCINSNVKGEYLDEKIYWPIFETASKLRVPIYLHPRAPSKYMLKPFLAYPSLSRAMFGFGAEVSLHAMRLICSGLFDLYPNIQIILGHLGEGLPYWLWRMDNRWKKEASLKYLKKSPAAYIRDNFYITTSGMFWPPAITCAYQGLGAEKILFAVDYPYESMSEAVQFISDLKLPVKVKENIAHSNAERLFGI